MHIHHSILAGGRLRLALPLFETMLAGTPLFSLPILAVLVIGYVDPDLPLLLMLVQASFAGWIVLCWSKQTHQYRLEADQERRDRYELEILKGERYGQCANGSACRAQRASSNLPEAHDEVGHELTAALLAFQAFETLWRENDPQAEEMFAQAQMRLSSSALERGNGP